MPRAVRRTTREIEKHIDTPAPHAQAEPEKKTALPVKVVGDGGARGFGNLWEAVTPVLAPLAAVGLAVVLVIFMLIRREVMRAAAVVLRSPTPGHAPAL